MIQKNLKQIIQLTISLGIAGWIFWFLYRDIELDSLIAQVKSSNWIWIITSLTIALSGYWLRGWRWGLLIQEDEGLKVTPNRAFHAVMVGYLVNMLIPRAGEVARCGVLTRTNGVSLGHLLGTVIVERSVDLIFLTFIVLLAFLVEKELFLNLANQLVDLDAISSAVASNIPIFLGGLFIFILLIYLVFRRFRNHSLVDKIQHFIREIGSGLKSVGKLRNPNGFLASSISIWIIYFLTMFTVALGIQSTANLSSSEVLLVMVMGSIGMIAPVQGGIGTFHALVAFILIQLGISEQDGKIFAAIIHGTQVILVLVVGLISWIILVRIPAWKKPF
jgi:hypothetical protein